MSVTGGPNGGLEGFLQERLRTHSFGQSDPTQLSNPGTQEPNNASLNHTDITVDVTSPLAEQEEDILFWPFVANKHKIINRILQGAKFDEAKVLTKVTSCINKVNTAKN